MNTALRVWQTQDGRTQTETIVSRISGLQTEAVQISGETSSRLTQPSVILSLHSDFRTRNIPDGSVRFSSFIMTPINMSLGMGFLSQFPESLTNISFIYFKNCFRFIPKYLMISTASDVKIIIYRTLLSYYLQS